MICQWIRSLVVAKSKIRGSGEPVFKSMAALPGTVQTVAYRSAIFKRRGIVTIGVGVIYISMVLSQPSSRDTVPLNVVLFIFKNLQHFFWGIVFLPTTTEMYTTRVSYETNFDSKQPKLEPKLVSTLSETRRLFRLNIETGSFGVSIEPKQNENNRNKPKKGFKLL
jgi:hypothetical protein